MAEAVKKTTAMWAPSDYVALAGALLDVVVGRNRWIHRVVETITFIDDYRFSRHVSVDLTIPTWPGYLQCESVLPDNTYIVPLALLKRRNLVRFDVVDESNAALPVITKAQQTILDEAMLLSARELQKTSPSDDAQSLLDGLTAELDGAFFLCVLVCARPGQRRVLKYSYEDSPGSSKRGEIDLLWWLLRRLGWLATPVDIPCPEFWYGGSYHVEAALPDELFFERGRLVASRPGKQEQKSDELDAQANSERLHLHPTRVAPFENRDVHLRAAVRMRPDGLLSAALLVGMLTSALFVAGLLLRLEKASSNGDVTAALLLALPGVFGAYVFRPGEHKLVSRVATGVRWVVGLLVLASFGGAGLVAIRFESGGRIGLWEWLTAVSVVATVVIAVAWAWSRVVRWRPAAGGA